MGERSAAKGVVKSFDPTKGYSFIEPDDGDPDVFVDASAVEKASHTALEGVHN